MIRTIAQAYMATTYSCSELKLSLRICENSSELAEILLQKQKPSFGFITAWNPSSKLLSQELNRERNKQLENDLKKSTYFKGEGIADDGQWSSEESFLILGMSKKDLFALAENFSQNAFVYGELNGNKITPELVWIREGIQDQSLKREI